MKHVQAMTRLPHEAQDEVPTSAKIQFVVSVLNAFEPLLTAKEANENPFE